MSQTLKRSESPNKNVSRQVSRQSMYKKALAGTAALLAGITSATAVASAAPAAAGVQLKLILPNITQQNTGERGCQTNYEYRNFDRYSDPKLNYGVTGTQKNSDGRLEYVNLQSDWLMYNQPVDYKSKLRLTYTASNPNDYFVNSKGEHVRSINVDRSGPPTVSDPAFCLDDIPHPKPINVAQSTSSSVIVDPLVNIESIDLDNTNGQLRLTAVNRTQGNATASIVTLANGRKAIKVTYTGSQASGTKAYVQVVYSITDPIGRTGAANLNIDFTVR